MTVVVLGSANFDTVVAVHRHPNPGETVHGTGSRNDAGGKGLNQAIASARAGADTVFVGAVGDDEAGHVLRRALLSSGVRTCLATSQQPSGSAIVVVADSGENSIVVLSGANADAPGIADVGRDVIAALGPGDVVLAQLEIPVQVACSLLDLAQARGALTILNAAPSSDVPMGLLDVVDVLIVNEHECRDISRMDTAAEGAHRLAQLVGTVIVTLGSEGALIVAGGATQEVPAFRVDAVDTTAAGDTFCGAFAARITASCDFPAATRFGSAAAALSVQKFGASTSAPTQEQIYALLDS